MINLNTRAIYRWAAGAVAALTLAACASPGELGPRHQPSGRDLPLPSAEFGVYTTAAEVAIAEANATIGRPLEPEAVEDRAPFELAPRRGCARAPDGRYPKAALLIHDLGGTPYEMRDVGRAFADACYLVRAILLPGHGTVPGDLLNTNSEEWVEATAAAVASFQDEAQRLVLVGFGLGGTLAVHHALSGRTPSGLELAGLVLLAPAFGAEAPLSWLRAPGAIFSGLAPGAAWARLLPDYDAVRYESLPREAERARTRLAKEIAAHDGSLDLPVFLAISAVDAEVDPAAARAWFCRRPSGPRQMIWYSTAPTPGTDCRFVIRRSAAAPPEIVDLSHIGLPIAPDNPRYGANSGYRECSHYYWENSPNWLICVDETKTSANAGIRYGEITPANLERHVVRRLTYNPDFNAMIGAALDFLADPAA